MDGELEEDDSSNNYLLSYPTAFIEESPETLCLELFDENQSGATVTVSVYAEDNQKQNNKGINLALILPSLNHRRSKSDHIEVTTHHICTELT